MKEYKRERKLQNLGKRKKHDTKQTGKHKKQVKIKTAEG